MQPTGGESSGISISSVEGGSPTSSDPDATPEQRRPVDACVICLEPVSERAVAVPCNHCSFDFLCLVSWLQERSKCPLCNTELEAVQYDWRAPDDFKTFSVVSTVTTQKATPSSLQTRRPSRRTPHQFRRPRRSHHTSPVTAPDAAISRRRHVYRHQLYSLHVGSNRLSHFKDITPQLVTRSPELQSRARKWIRRELGVFDFLSPTTTQSASSSPQAPPPPRTTQTHTPTEARARRATNNTEFLLEYILAILKTVDIKASSGKAQDLLRPFLGRDNSNLFWHELGAWLRSPYAALEDWDRHVQYRVEIPDFETRNTPDVRLGCAADDWGDDAPRRGSGAGVGVFDEDYCGVDARVGEARRRYRPD